MNYSTAMATCLFPLLCGAQEWAPFGATWHYSHAIAFDISGYVRFEVTQDTVINGQTTRKIAQTTYTYNSATQQYGEYSNGPLFTHASNGIVWIYVPEFEVFDTLYRFNAVPGDHWELVPLPQLLVCEAQSRMVVVDTGTTVFDGIPLRWLAVDIHYIQQWDTQVWPDTIIERLGSTGSYMLPHDFCNSFIGGAQGGSLLCYNDGEIDYMHPLFSNCLFNTGIGSHGFSENMSLYPNPGRNGFELNIPAGWQGSFRIYNAHGTLVHRSLAISPPIYTNTAQWSPGVYFVTLVEDSGRTLSSKWVKE